MEYPQMFRIRQHFDARIAQFRDLANRILDREVHVSVGAKSKFHGLL